MGGLRTSQRERVSLGDEGSVVSLHVAIKHSVSCDRACSGCGLAEDSKSFLAILHHAAVHHAILDDVLTPHHALSSFVQLHLLAERGSRVCASCLCQYHSARRLARARHGLLTCSWSSYGAAAAAMLAAG
eukprot:scaffold159851_cov33-Tisochrysis_lutea.AAC.1